MTAWVDIQVNGYGGVDFSSEDLTAAGIDRVVENLGRRGTAVFCPTVVTASPAVYAHVLPLLAEACERHPERIPGIHLEGPFISPLEGAVGAHPREHVRAPSRESFRDLQQMARGRIRILTLAPEQPGAEDLIREAAGEGLLVAVGHTLAGEAEIERAVRAGARLSTHLGNGCPQQLNRHDNPIMAQLGSPLAASIIADGHHLPPSVLRAIIWAKGTENVLLVSDAAGIAGLPPGEYTCFGSRVRIEPSGRIQNLSAPGLAGSTATLEDCVRHLRQVLPLEPPAVQSLARQNALRLLGLSGRFGLGAGGPNPAAVDGAPPTSTHLSP